MTTLLTKKLGNHVAQQIIESITEPANTVYYLTASKHTVYSSGDDAVPTPGDSEQETSIDFYGEAIFGKKIGATDVSRMIPRYDWVSNTVYSMYDHTDADLFNKQFYTVVENGAAFYVYKVLDNNGGAASTIQPTNTSETACNFVTTADGYKWKLMYKIGSSDFNKFATTEYIPVSTSANVSSTSVDGAIDVIKVVEPGASYFSTLTGQFSADDLRSNIPTVSGNNTTYRLNANAASNSDFYVDSSIYLQSGTGAGQIGTITSYSASTRVIVIDTAFDTPPGTDTIYVIAPSVRIEGDGSNASGYAVISSNATVQNFVQKIEVVDRGSNYTYATAVVTGNTGGEVGGASLKVIIPPVGGHGTDSPKELGSSHLGISVNFSESESGFIPTDNDYRKFVILKDPLFSSVTLTIDNDYGTFASGETVYQINYKTLTGTVTTSASNTYITGVLTDFENALAVGDTILLSDPANNVQCLRTVNTIANSTSVSLNAAPSFNTSYATCAFAAILASGVKSGNSAPYLTMTDADPKFIVGKRVIGGTSGAWANVVSIDVQEKSYNNWATFDNRTRIQYTANTGVFQEDSTIFQTALSIANGSFHSANSTYLFFTSEKGPINADPATPIFESGTNVTYTPGSNKYVPDLVNRSGEVLYIENKDPITRSVSQSETFKLVLKF